MALGTDWRVMGGIQAGKYQEPGLLQRREEGKPEGWGGARARAWPGDSRAWAGVRENADGGGQFCGPQWSLTADTSPHSEPPPSSVPHLLSGKAQRPFMDFLTKSYVNTKPWHLHASPLGWPRSPGGRREPLLSPAPRKRGAASPPHTPALELGFVPQGFPAVLAPRHRQHGERLTLQGPGVASWRHDALQTSPTVHAVTVGRVLKAEGLPREVLIIYRC